MRRLSIAVFSWLVFLRLAHAASDPAADAIGQIEKEFQLRLGVAAIDSKSGRRIEYRGDERFPMCSTFKLLAVATVLERVDRHEANLDRFIPYSQRDILSYAPVTKEHLSEGGMHLGALCEAASEESDNTAANLILQTIGGPAGWTKFARSIGDSVSRLDRIEPELNRFVPGDDRDTTTAKAMCANLDRLFTGDVLSVESRTKFETWLQANRTGDELIRAGVPHDWRVGDKTGRSGEGAINDIAVLRPPDGSPIFVAIYSLGQKGNDVKQSAAIAKIAALVGQAFRQAVDKPAVH